MSKAALVILFCGLFCAFEPVAREKLTYAIGVFDSPRVAYDQADKTYTTGEDTSNHSKKSHAPEPSTFILFLSGLSSMVLRFAKKSFERFKRYMDLFLATLGLFVFSPLIFFIGVLIKLTSKGPVIYKQNRMGKNGKVFRIYKLRTMLLDAEKTTGAVWAKKNDPRITQLGKVLRKTHLDEIPQLFNVIKGDMSIVGPRPERPEFVRNLKKTILDYEKRLQVKPGITGLAQVVHKYDETIEDVRKKIRYDLAYIKGMCLQEDLKIMAQTFVVVFTGKGAN